MTQTIDFRPLTITNDLADAQEFIESTACTECDLDRCTVLNPDRYCHGCRLRGCDCVLTEDPHERDTLWCEDCAPMCLGTCCDPDSYMD